ncbi:MAG: hypothetical protein AAF447_28435, partial [Myxococcota bacterium]
MVPRAAANVDEDCNPATLGDQRPCLTGRGVAGNQGCLVCASWDTCAAPEEVCNGCDDDVDGAAHEAFDCTFGTTTTCSAPGRSRELRRVHHHRARPGLPPGGLTGRTSA